MDNIFVVVVVVDGKEDGRRIQKVGIQYTQSQCK